MLSLTQIQNILDTIKSNLEKYNPIISKNDLKVINKNIERLNRIDELLSVEKYKLVFIGAPGTGKTTLICNYLDLLLDDYVNKQPDEISLLSTASGRTTAAEVHILNGKRTLVRIEPCKLKEQEGYIRSYCRTVWDKVFNSENDSKTHSESAELDRIIRNMAGYNKNIEVENYIRQNFQHNDYLKFCNFMIAKIKLTSRNTMSIVYDGQSDFKQWLKKTFSEINLGKMPDFPIPKRIFIQIAEEDLILPLPEWIGRVIDSRGFDGEGRLDVKTLINQDDTINIILDKITTPIDARLHPIFNSWIVKESVDVIPRLALVIACRNNELNSVCEAENEEEGEEIKRSEIDFCINANKLNYNNNNTFFYNAQGSYETKNVPRKNGTRITNISVVTDINKDNATIYRDFFSEHISEIKDNYHNSLFAEADDILQRTLNIFNSVNRQSIIQDTERHRIVSKLTELKDQTLRAFINNKKITTSFNSAFDKIREQTHWASVRKTTEMYGEWDKCHIYAIMEAHLWTIISKELSPFRKQINNLISSIDDQLLDYMKSYQTAEREAYLQLKKNIEDIGYNQMFAAFNYSADEPRAEFWNTAQSFFGRGYLCNVISYYKEWIDENQYDNDIRDLTCNSIILYFDTIIGIIS